mmetsp:Transcript_14767/g.60294  ORF Transcript_14767/g.60294 Transcript_14767/m.60294 type:complete len:105 (+) Transcript_14767:1432-1746(+)
MTTPTLEPATSATPGATRWTPPLAPRGARIAARMSTRTRHPPPDNHDPRAPAIVAFENALTKKPSNWVRSQKLDRVPRAFERAPSLGRRPIEPRARSARRSRLS